jgi:hypothetical protein
MNPTEYPTQPVTRYNVKAAIMGKEHEGAETVATGYTTRGQAVSAAKTMQATIPDPEEGDVFFYAEKA